ncbi:MAG: RNA-directed DNA polymerase [Candidatus Marinimicrobia bacterium]|nr:RNA-directed DNA polymerase [Candidatus Neomarinimicrobiota bacterium]
MHSLIQPEKKKYFFLKHLIQKRGKHRAGDYRIVWQAIPDLADSYKSFARRFDLFVRAVEPRFPHPSAYGYVRGRSTIDNAMDHCGAPLILHADIASFFPSISSYQLRVMFERLGINGDMAGHLTNFVTIDDSLPLGLHPSPMLANIVCLDLDEKLSKVAAEGECVYTRYADDITISGRTTVPKKEIIKTILDEEGFCLSERKFRITKPGQAHYVTGLSVSDSKLPHAPRVMKKNLRQELYYCGKYGIENHLGKIGVDDTLQQGINRIDGYVKYVSHIEKEALPNLREEWNTLLEKEGLKISYATKEGFKTRIIDFYVDETEIQHHGIRFLAVSFVQTEDTMKIDITTMATLRQHMADPFSGGRKRKLEKKKLHYTDATEDLRKAYIDKLSILPFRAYLVFGELKTPDDYEDLYVELIKKILPHRLMGCDQAIVRIIVEENSKIRKFKIINTITDIYKSLEENNNRRPFSIKTIVGGKSDYLCFSVPDFLLAIFSGFATNSVDPKERRILFFEKLRDKYRIILDGDKNVVYSRRRPFEPW